MTTSGGRWSALAMMFLFGLAAAMQLQSVQSLAPLLVAQVGLSYAEIGVLTGVFMLPGVFLALPGGMLAGRLGDRRAMAIALALMLGSGVVMATTQSYAVMVVARVAGGAGSAVLTTQGLKVVTDWFAGREISTAMAINAASFGLGIGVSTGPVAAALLGSEERLEYTLVGDTVNLAQRLQDLARPGGCLVFSEATRSALSSPPECEALGEQAIKGRQSTVSAYKYQVVGAAVTAGGAP